MDGAISVMLHLDFWFVYVPKGKNKVWAFALHIIRLERGEEEDRETGRQQERDRDQQGQECVRATREAKKKIRAINLVFGGKGKGLSLLQLKPTTPSASCNCILSEWSCVCIGLFAFVCMVAGLHGRNVCIVLPPFVSTTRMSDIAIVPFFYSCGHNGN